MLKGGVVEEGGGGVVTRTRRTLIIHRKSGGIVVFLTTHGLHGKCEFVKTANDESPPIERGREIGRENNVFLNSSK